MKKSLFIIAFFCTLFANGQDYLISFSGTGASTIVSTVKVENLTAGTSLIVSGSDILHLTAIITGVNSIKDDLLSKIKIYPNPMTDYSTVQIYPPVTGDAVITVVDITGKPVAQVKSYLENLRQDFRLSGLNSGFYLIIVKGNNYQLSQKFLSNGNYNRTIRIEKANNVIQTIDEKATITDNKGVQATVEMEYTSGDRLKFTGISGNYSTVKTDIPESNKTISFNFLACSDGDNNNYPVVEIGTQVWMAENLKTTKYRNGDLIETTTPYNKNILPEITPIYQWPYDGDESNVATYGRLYTWYTVTGNTVCPAGWHIPTDAEWTILTDYLGGLSKSGGKLKEVGYTHWNSPNSGAINESGFTALPGGYRYSLGGFGGLGSDGLWWSLTESNINYAWTRGLGNSFEDAYGDNNSKRTAYSVRCLKGEVESLSVLTSTAISSITQSTATSGGNVSSDGGTPVTARGVCWSTSANPTIANNKTIDGTGTGTFSSSITGLTPNTSYYLRAYATNSVGTAYGSELILKTYTGTVTDVEGNVYNTVTIGSQIWLAENLKTSRYRNGDLIGTTTPATLDFNTETAPKYQWAYNGDESNVATYGRLYTWYTLIDNRNLCPAGWHVPSHDEWSTMAGYLSDNGYGYEGSYSIAKSMAATSGWTPLTIPGTVGYDQARNNSSGFTALPGSWRFSTGVFGSLGRNASWWSSSTRTTIDAWHSRVENDVNYFMQDYHNMISGHSVRCLHIEVQSLPVLTTALIASITQSTASSGGNISCDGGTPVTARGLCWSTSVNPTIADNKTIDGPGTGAFYNSMKGLSAGTTYYVRAYAINDIGINYGNQFSFNTRLSDVEGNIYSTVTIGTQVWMAENLRTSKYNDGEDIPYGWPLDPTNSEWNLPTTPGYCWYNNDESYKIFNGALYNWLTVNTGKLCPTGWHVPTSSEWNTLIDYLWANKQTFEDGSVNVAKSIASTSGWEIPPPNEFNGAVGRNQTTNNSTGFNAYPSGLRHFYDFFTDIGKTCVWWSATGPDNPWTFEISFRNSTLSQGSAYKRNGFSVRCVKG